MDEANWTGQRRRIRLNLFWRTFFLLALLLTGTIAAWLQSFRALEYGPRAAHTAEQIATMVNLSRTALLLTPTQEQLPLLQDLQEQEGILITPKLPTDTFEDMGQTTLGQHLRQELHTRLGANTTVARSVNGIPGIWVSIDSGTNAVWLLMDNARLTPPFAKTVLGWTLAAILLSLAGAALIAHLLSKPIQQLSQATYRFREGDFHDSQLDEEAATNEIRDLNIGFNRMAERLAKIEQDRAVMLAGISHDLRTPLARLRLETEMSVSDDLARQHMVADIEQLDAIIDKFMDYARPVSNTRDSVHLHGVINTCVYSIQEYGEIAVQLFVPDNIFVYVDEIELSRVITNLLENARRYGHTPGTHMANVDIVATTAGKHVLLQIRDHGPGVPDNELANLLKPFFRGDSARTSAAGAGLGLCIVEKSIQRMGGKFSLSNAPQGGLCAQIRLDKAPTPETWSSKDQRLQRPSEKRNAFVNSQFRLE